MTYTASVGTIEAVAASGPGALPGFEFRCSRCIEVASFSIRSMTEDHSRRHAAWHDVQDKFPRRKRSKAAA